MINYTKLINKLKEKGITTYAIRKHRILGQEQLRKIRMCSVSDSERNIYLGLSDEDIIKKKLFNYEKEKGKPFAADVSTKTIEDLCQLLECQVDDIIEWKIELDKNKSYEEQYKK